MILILPIETLKLCGELMFGLKDLSDADVFPPALARELESPRSFPLDSNDADLQPQQRSKTSP